MNNWHAIHSEQNHLQKQAKTLFQKWWWIGGVSFFALLFIGFLGFLIKSPLFSVVSITLHGSNTISSENILRVVKPAIISSSWWGPDNILSWNEKNIEATIIKSFPQIARVDVVVAKISRTVDLKITDRIWYGVWCVRDAPCYAFDEKGIVFSEMPNVEGALILKINDENKHALVLGMSALREEGWTQDILATIQMLKNSAIAFDGVTIRDFALKEWVITLHNGPEIFLSFLNHNERTANLLQSIALKADISKLQYIDFRVPERIYYQ